MRRETTEIHGVWWHPDRPDQRLPGTLRLQVDSPPELTVHGTLLHGTPDLIQCVHGHGSSNVEYRLQGVHAKHAPFSLGQKPSVRVQQLSVLRAYRNLDAAKPEDAPVSSHIFGLEHLTEWLRQDGISYGRADSKPTTATKVQRELPPEQRIQLDENTSLVIEHYDLDTVPFPRHRVVIENRSQVRLEYAQTIRWGLAQHGWLPWASYLYLATGRPCRITHEEFRSGTPPRTTTSLDAGRRAQNRDPLWWEACVFTPPHLEQGLDRSLQAWHAFADQMRPVVEAHMTFLDGRLYPNERVMVLASALESYAAYRLNRRKKTTSELEALEEKLGAALPDADAGWLIGLAKSSNGLSFKELVTTLILRHRDELGISTEEAEQRARERRDTRNAIAHQDPEHKGAARREGLQVLTNFAYTLLSLALMHEAQVRQDRRNTWAAQQLRGFSTYMIPD